MSFDSQLISPRNGLRPSALQSVGRQAREKSWIRTAFHILGWASLLWIISVLASQALAQVNVSDALQPYRDFKPSEDLATRVMEGLLGESYTSPLTVGLTSNTIFGAIFLVFNVIVFAIGTVFASYGVISSIVQTAHEGVVLGKRMSAIWMPIRMVTGIGGLVPAFGGFSLSQVAMLLATSMGISFGNFAYDQALTAANTSATLTNPSFSRTDPSKDGAALANALFEQHLCVLRIQKTAKSYVDNGLMLPPDKVLVARTFESLPEFRGIKAGTLKGVAYGTNQDASSCGAAGLKHKTYFYGQVTESGRSSINILGSGSSVLGFRSGAVNYDSINQQTWIGYASNFDGFVSRINTMADAYATAKDKKDIEVPRPNDEIRAEGIRYTGAVQSYTTEHKNINEAALTNMRKFGFFGAGSFYSTHAEVNAAVVQASDAVDFLIIPPKGNSQKITGDYDFSYGTPEAAAGGIAGNMSEFNKTDFCIVKQNATGNCSIGQAIIGALIDAGTSGAGGASTVVDPIIAMKNIGDYLMMIGNAALLLAASGSIGQAAVGAVAGVTAVAGVAATATGVGAGAGAGLLAASAMTASLLALKEMLPYIGAAFLTVGALCAIYIPMVPFLNWVSALVQYLCIVVESFAAAPLWAFAHLQAEGEGMGQKTERGYLYLLNLLFRPILMVIAFFAASALVILLGSVVMQMYLPTIAAAQGNSLTGLASVIFYILLFFIIMNTVIQGLFHLTSELADDAIGWIGGIGRQNIGKDTEGKVNALFLGGGRFAGAAINETARAGSAAASAAARAAEAAGKTALGLPGTSVK